MSNAAKSTRQHRTITVDFHDESTYFQLISNGKAFLEFIIAFVLSVGFQLAHKATCTGGGCLTRHSLTFTAYPFLSSHLEFQLDIADTETLVAV
jgi:hypothetical protein